MPLVPYPPFSKSSPRGKADDTRETCHRKTFASLHIYFAAKSPPSFLILIRAKFLFRPVDGAAPRADLSKKKSLLAYGSLQYLTSMGVSTFCRRAPFSLYTSLAAGSYGTSRDLHENSLKEKKIFDCTTVIGTTGAPSSQTTSFLSSLHSPKSYPEATMRKGLHPLLHIFEGIHQIEGGAFPGNLSSGRGVSDLGVRSALAVLPPAGSGYAIPGRGNGPFLQYLQCRFDPNGGKPLERESAGRCEITIISFSRSICRGGLAALIGVTGKPYPSCLSCHSHPIRPFRAPSPRGEGCDTRIPSSKKRAAKPPREP